MDGDLAPLIVNMNEKDKMEGEVGGLNIKSSPSNHDNSQIRLVCGDDVAGNSTPTSSDERNETLGAMTSPNLSEGKEEQELQYSDNDNAEDWEYDAYSSTGEVFVLSLQ